MALRCCASGALQLKWEVAVVHAEHNVSPTMAYLRKTSISYAAYKRQRGRWRCLDLQRMQNFRHVLHTEPKTVPVVWKASSTIPSSSSEAAKWNTEKTFFQPDLMLWACEWTICATQRTTMSRMVADLQNWKKKKVHEIAMDQSLTMQSFQRKSFTKRLPQNRGAMGCQWCYPPAGFTYNNFQNDK